jgi:two-component system nitrogen regulation response regulator GlnG
MESLLVIDDEPSVRRAVQEVMQTSRLRVLTAQNSAQAVELFRQQRPLLVLLDIRLGFESGLDVFARLRELDPAALVVFMTGHGTSDTAIETIKRGAFDYLVKPLDFDQLQQTVDQALKISRLMHSPAQVETAQAADEELDRLVGNGPAMQSLCKQIGRVAPQDVNALVLGESGTGKELVARAIVQHSRRHKEKFLAINCAAIPEALLESELFGHEQGAFTGADRQRVGKFEQCHNGTIFLDEVGDMPSATQAKILRLLQDGQFQRVGGNETLRVNVRIIAATNQDLEQMIEEGKFRRDLFYRLRGVTLHLPPLRDRAEDIPELAQYFLTRFNRQLGTAVQSIAPETLEKLQAYRWPGNIRELQSVIREALIVSTGPTLLPDFLPLEVRGESSASATVPPRDDLRPLEEWRELGRFIERSLAAGAGDVYREALQRFDRLILNQAMSAAGGLQCKASELLALSRPTLRAKLRVVGSAAKGSGPNEFRS